MKNHLGAIQDFNKAAEIKPYHAEIYYYRGNSKVELKKYTDAIDDYTQYTRFL